MKFDVPMTNSNRKMNVRQYPENLVCMELHIYQQHPWIQLIVMFDNLMNSFRNVLKYKIKMKFIIFGG